MTSANKKRVAALVAVLVAGGALAYISMGGIEKNLVYYWNAQELLDRGEKAHGAVVRLGGVVKNGSVHWDAQTLKLDFDVGVAPEPGGATVTVHASGAPPQMFREGMGVVVEGRYDGKVFAADRVLVKHSNEYRPPAPGEKASEVYSTLVE
jgi:cytochrome c-type biogenesis protein CcmE